MELKQPAMAGTLESSDVMVKVFPSDEGVDLELNSTVISQYGEQIRKVILETINELGVSNVKLFVDDRGAIDLTIRSRVQCAIYRAVGQTKDIPWGGVFK